MSLSTSHARTINQPSIEHAVVVVDLLFSPSIECAVCFPRPSSFSVSPPFSANPRRAVLRRNAMCVTAPHVANVAARGAVSVAAAARPNSGSTRPSSTVARRMMSPLCLAARAAACIFARPGCGCVCVLRISTALPPIVSTAAVTADDFTRRSIITRCDVCG